MASDRAPARATGERGTVVVVVAATMAALVVLVSIVVDLGGARTAKAHDQDAADAVALAGAAKLNATGGDNQPACTAAWNYIVTNTDITASPTPSCVTFAGTCDEGHARELTITRTDFVITFVNPVPDDHDLFDGQPAEETDSTPCLRFGVEIQHTWHHLLQTGAETLQTQAVARFTHGPGNVDAPLVALDPHGCEALTVTGNSHVTTNTSTGAPGYVAIDSDGAACPAGKKVIVDTTGNAQITAGAISMWALTTGNTARAYDPADVGVGRGFYPAPIASSAPVGRSRVDWRYNCGTGNACPAAGTAYVDDLVSAEGSGLPAGFTRWTSLYSCSPSGNVVVPKGNWYIDCGGGLSTSGSITFRGGDIVADGPFDLTGNGALRVNCDAASAAAACPTDPATTTTMFLRHGGLSKSGNVNVSLYETFVYIAQGTLGLTGTGTLTWTAPNDPSDPFDDLLLWDEDSSTISMNGDVNTTLEGIFFAPNAPLSLTGNTGANALGSQMFVRTAALTGASSLTLAPRSDRVLQLGGAGSALIR